VLTPLGDGLSVGLTAGLRWALVSAEQAIRRWQKAAPKRPDWKRRRDPWCHWLNEVRHEHLRGRVRARQLPAFPQGNNPASRSHVAERVVLDDQGGPWSRGSYPNTIDW